MHTGTLTDGRKADSDAELEFNGMQLRVKSQHLAALLTGDDDRVRVVRDRDDGADGTRPAAHDAGVALKSAPEMEGGVAVRLGRQEPGL